MVSDTLHDAVAELDGYLGSKTYDDWYDPALRARIVAVRNEMDDVRSTIDSAPPTSAQEDTSLEETTENLLLWAERGFRELANDIATVRREGFDSEQHAPTNADFMVSEAAFRFAQLFKATGIEPPTEDEDAPTMGEVIELPRGG